MSSALSWVKGDALVKPSVRRMNDPVTITSSIPSSCAIDCCATGTKAKDTAAHSKRRLCVCFDFMFLSIIDNSIILSLKYYKKQ